MPRSGRCRQAIASWTQLPYESLARRRVEPGPRATRRTDPLWRVRPHRPAPARHGRLYLAQMAVHHDRRAHADRLPLNDTESLIQAAVERDVERARAAWRPAP